jgi:hypothetical protein
MKTSVPCDIFININVLDILGGSWEDRRAELIGKLNSSKELITGPRKHISNIKEFRTFNLNHHR